MADRYWTRSMLWVLAAFLPIPFGLAQAARPATPKAAVSRAQVSSSASPPIAWYPWSEQIFAQAAREHKFVLLELEAVWCHWCHVMDQNTYSDPAVRRLMKERYLASRWKDSRPDIIARTQPAASGMASTTRQGLTWPTRWRWDGRCFRSTRSPATGRG